MCPTGMVMAQMARVDDAASQNSRTFMPCGHYPSSENWRNRTGIGSDRISKKFRVRYCRQGDTGVFSGHYAVGFPGFDMGLSVPHSTPGNLSPPRLRTAFLDTENSLCYGHLVLRDSALGGAKLIGWAKASAHGLKWGRNALHGARILLAPNTLLKVERPVRRIRHRGP
jgi:hypothetical protein